MKRENYLILSVAGLVTIAAWAITVRSATSMSLTMPMPGGWSMSMAWMGMPNQSGLERAATCLRHCRSPLDFFSHHRLQRVADSLTFGLHHGAYCAACCWGLMAIQLVLGIMSLPLMALVAGVIFLEKQWKHGETVAVVTGIAAIVGGALWVLRAAA